MRRGGKVGIFSFSLLYSNSPIVARSRMSYESLLHSLLFVIDFFWSPCLKKEWQYLIGLPSRSKFLPLLFSLNFFLDFIFRCYIFRVY